LVDKHQHKSKHTVTKRHIRDAYFVQITTTVSLCNIYYGDTLMTLATRYNAEAQRLMPEHADSLAVEPSINNASHIDEIVFRRSEYLGGMAAVLLALISDSK
jgi:hypothetical protein